MPNQDALYSVRVPPNATVLSPRSTGENGEKLGGEPMEHPVVLEGIGHAKAMKFAHMNDATVTDSEGKVIAKPSVKLTDERPEAAAAVAEANAAELVELRATITRLEKELSRKADRPGPKKKA